MPRAPWRRRRTTDSPRPAGRRWAGRLRRSSTFARQVLLVRVGRRDGAGRRRRRPGLRPSTATSIGSAAGTASTGTSAPSVQVDRAGQPGRSPRQHPGRRRRRRCRSRCCPASARRPAGSSSRWSTPAPWPACCSACSPIFLAMQRRRAPRRAGCLIACVVFDGLDGALARKLGVASPFGAQMDSLADMCSFGLAAPVVVYASLAGVGPDRRRRGRLRARRRLRGDPAGPVQRLAEGRPLLLRRADHHGRGGARPGHR